MTKKYKPLLAYTLIFIVRGVKDPSFFYRENNPPMFSKKQEHVYMTLEEEVKRAVAHETDVHLEELDIRFFEDRGVLKRERLLKEEK